MSEKLFETIADIAYYAGFTKYYSGNSREDVNCFIYWAKEFELIHKETDWNVIDYLLCIDAFVNKKITAAKKIQHRLEK